MDSSFPFSNLFQSSELKVVEYRFYQAMGSSLQLEPQLNGSREEMSLGQCAWKRWSPWLLLNKLEPRSSSYYVIVVVDAVTIYDYCNFDLRWFVYLICCSQVHSRCALHFIPRCSSRLALGWLPASKLMVRLAVLWWSPEFVWCRFSALLMVFLIEVGEKALSSGEVEDLDWKGYFCNLPRLQLFEVYCGQMQRCDTPMIPHDAAESWCLPWERSPQIGEESCGHVPHIAGSLVVQTFSKKSKTHYEDIKDIKYIDT